MNIFKTRKKFEINQRDPMYKVKYLGNVQTALMKGDGCVDKPTGVLWNNYAKSNGSVGINMTLTLGTFGMKAVTQEQGVTEYRAHRISYCIAHPKYPKVFVWVYRHEGKKMKVELRCHAVLCKTEEKAKAMAVQLHDKLTFSLNEFMRDKTRRQNSRLTMQRTNSLGGQICVNNNNSGINPGVPLRQKMLSTGQKFKPSVEHSSSAPKLVSITEDQEGETRLQEIMEEEEAEEGIGEEEELSADDCSNPEVDTNPAHGLLLTSKTEDEDLSFDPEVHDLTNGVYELSIEIGNDIDEFKKDSRVQHQLNHIDSDDNSSESGFSEQDTKESLSTGSGNCSSETAHGQCTTGSCLCIEDTGSDCCPAGKALSDNTFEHISGTKPNRVDVGLKRANIEQGSTKL